MPTVAEKEAQAIHLTPEDLAKRLKIHEGTPANWRSKGRGPAYITLAHGTVRYPLSEVLAWEAARKVKPVKPVDPQEPESE
jgi:hypothetical protein